MFKGIKRASVLLISMIASGNAAEQNFNFDTFERHGNAGAEQAKEFLEAAFPPGSDVQPAVAEITRAGAKCQLGHDRGDFYFCKYIRPGHGLMRLVSSIEWHVVFNVDPETKTKITSIAVVRGATGL